MTYYSIKGIAYFIAWLDRNGLLHGFIYLCEAAILVTVVSALNRFMRGRKNG